MKKKEISDIRDLAEFCEEWPGIRDRVSDISVAEDVNDPEVREIVWWLTRLADKVFMDFADGPEQG